MRLHHAVDGSGPPLVLAGSLGSTLALWEPQLPALAARFRVVRFDHPGHGGSPVPDGPISVDDVGRGVLALLDELGIEQASFCGLSLGGAVAQWLGVYAPERVDRLALCCASARFGTAEGWHQRAEAVRRDGMAAVADSVVARWFTPSFPDVWRARWLESLLAVPREGYARCCEALAGFDLRDELGRIAAPTLVLAGAEDPSVPPEDVELLAGRIPAARLVHLDGAAHLANVEQAEAFDAALFDHLEREAV